MNVEEIPLVFDCENNALIGMVHRPESPSHCGVLSLVAGGPQYRAGYCRQLVYMARDFSAQGIPVMRFDHRGIGDSDGKFLDFLHLEKDIGAAIKSFKEAVPELREVVLWGGCNAASGIMIAAHRHPEVAGMIISNPYAHTEATQAVAVRNHYMRRLKDRSFWVKLFKLGFNPLPYAQSAIRSALRRIRPSSSGKAHADEQDNRHFTELMLTGFKQFRGQVLLVMSGQSLTSEEFDVLVSNSPDWKRAFDAASITRENIAHADQAFSNVDARDALINTARRWLACQHHPK